MAEEATKDFFISYNKADRGWAEWIAWKLENEGYSTILQAWDFRPGGNFVLQMNEATKQTKRTIAVLSPDYLDLTAVYSQSEWAAAVAQDPIGRQGKLIPICVRECTPTGLFASLTPINLVDLTEAAAFEMLLKGVQQGRAKPSGQLPYPGSVTAAPGFPGLLWNIPDRRNPFFTGREDLIKTLHERLAVIKTAALTQPQAISGLGGIGKTQIAIEYAYRYRREYPAIFWVRAAMRDTLIADFVTLATLLSLPEQHEQDQNRVVAAVKRWFTFHKEWLLILDNADDLAAVANFIPAGDNGYVLLTTRDQAVATIAQVLEVEKMNQEEATRLLLQRAGVLTLGGLLDQVPAENRTIAESLVKEMDGLPLALDQAGAYITQMKYDLSRYLTLYQQRRADLLKWQRRVAPEYPKTVATTWSLSFEQVEQRSPAAADLLRLCAFLDPDVIPETLITKGASELGPFLQHIVSDDFQFNEVIDVLLSFSLVRRLADIRSLAIHRLVQVVLKDGLNFVTQQQWADRAVCTLNAVFPSERWLPIHALLSHSLAGARLIDDYQFSFPEASRLLDRTATYLQDTARYQEAEPLFLHSLAIKQKIPGPEHPETGAALNNLALLYRYQGRYQEAEPLYLCSLTIKEKTLGPEHPETSATLSNLAFLYRDQGRYQEAEPLLLRALTIQEKTLGPEHSEISTTLNCLGLLYYAQGRHQEAEPLFLRALTIDEKTLGLEHPETSTTLNNLALLYHAQGRYQEAKPLYLRALTIRETLGPEHSEISTTLNNLAGLYHIQGRYQEAESFYLRALAVREKTLGPEHPGIVTTLKHYVSLLQQMHRPEEAAQLEARTQVLRAKQQS